MTGDSVLIFAVNYTQSGQGPQAGTKSLYAFDLKAREYRWKVDSIGIPANNSRIPEVYDNKVYVPTEWRIHCFDLFTGNKIWEAEMPNNTQQIDFAFSPSLYPCRCIEPLGCLSAWPFAIQPTLNSRAVLTDVDGLQKL